MTMTVLGIWLPGFVGRRRMPLPGFIGTGIRLMLAEIFPLAIRGFAMGLAVLVLWTVNGAIFFILRFAPETKGHGLESLEEHLRSPEVLAGTAR